MILKQDAVWIGNAVTQIPGDSGWLQQENGQDFCVLAVELMELGLDRYKAIEILTRAYWAVAQEFGL